MWQDLLLLAQAAGDAAPTGPDAGDVARAVDEAVRELAPPNGEIAHPLAEYMWLVWTVVGVLAATPLLVAVVTVLQVRKLSNPDLRVRAVAHDDYPDRYAQAGTYQAWAMNNGFEWLGSYIHDAMKSIFIAVWLHRDEPTYFVLYIHPVAGVMHDFVSIYDNEVGVTTGSTKDGLMLPQPPGRMMQAFPKIGVEQMYQRHREARRYVETELGVKPRIDLTRWKLEDVLADAITSQMRYVRSLPLWWLRGPYWYFIRRNQLVGKSIVELHQRGVMKMPTDGPRGEDEKVIGERD